MYKNKTTKMKLSIWFIIILLFFILTINCSEEERFKVDSVDGIQIIHNHKPLWEESKKIGLEFCLKIGSVEETDENYIFSMIGDANIDKNGNYYIVDTQENRIQKYDSLGNYKLTIGRKGKGPGEFMTPGFLSIDKKGDIVVIERRNIRLQIIPSDLLNMDFIQIFEMKTDYISILPLSNNNYVINTIDFFYPGGYEKSPAKRIIITDQEMNILSKFLEFKMFENYDNQIRPWAYFMGNMTVIAVDSRDDIFVAYQTENRIEKYSFTGKLLLRFDRNLPYDITETVVDGKRGDKNVQFTQTSVNIGVDYKDRLWINSYFKKPSKPGGGIVGNCVPENLYLEIFDNEGHLLCTMNPFTDFVMLKVVGDKILFMDKDKVSLHVYRIIEI